MNKLIIAVIVLVVVSGSIFALTKKSVDVPPVENNPKTSQSESNIKDINMGNKPNQEIGDILDLTNQTEVIMDIKDFKYEKPNIKIKKGTKVTWTNQDTIKHNVMLDHNDGDKPHDAPTREEVKQNKLAGPLLAKGESYSFTFNEVTANPYHCSPHPFMKGSITVVE